MIPRYKRQPTGHWRNSTRYKALRANFFRTFGAYGACSICHEPVNMALTGRVRLGPTVDHIVPVSRGGAPLNPSNWRLAHRGCNSEKGVKLASERKAPTRHAEPGSQLATCPDCNLPARALWKGCYHPCHGRHSPNA